MWRLTFRRLCALRLRPIQSMDSLFKLQGCKRMHTDRISHIAPYMDSVIEPIAQIAHRFSPHRDIRLFREFLPNGYKMITLSSVNENIRDANLLVKVCLGTIITLYDDLADHPKFHNPDLLKVLYQIPFSRKNPREPDGHPLYAAISELWDIVFSTISVFPHYHFLRQAFEFDILQVFNANRYAEMITDSPFLFNTKESRSYLPHNMGIVLVGTVDLMCSPCVDIKSIGFARSLFFEAQKAARIMNMIVTVDREVKEGDVTNELVFSIDRSFAILSLENEINEILRSLRFQNATHFSIEDYVYGMKNLFELHKTMQGVI